MSDTPLTDAALGYAGNFFRLSLMVPLKTAAAIERRLRFLQTASAETLTAMPDWSDESIDAELAKESEASNG